MRSETITLAQAEKIYLKAIVEGIVGGLNLTTYQMRGFEELLKEVRELENEVENKNSSDV